jgi:hypothetical protein
MPTSNSLVCATRPPLAEDDVQPFLFGLTLHKAGAGHDQRLEGLPLVGTYKKAVQPLFKLP